MSIITGSCSDSLASELYGQGLQERLQQQTIESGTIEEAQNRQTVQPQSATSEDTQLQNGEGKMPNEGPIGNLLDTHA